MRRSDGPKGQVHHDRVAVAARCLAALLVVGWACSEADSTEDVGSSHGDVSLATPDEFFNAWLEVICDHYSSCRSPMERWMKVIETATPSACKHLRRAMKSDDSALKKAIDDGLVIFNAAKARACIDDLKAAMEGKPCAPPLDGSSPVPTINDIESCRARITGTLEIGASCPIYQACKNGFCDWSKPSKVQCHGTCAALVPAGGACIGNSWSCTKGLLCIKGICAKPPLAGSVSGGDVCHSYNSCKTGFWCVLEQGLRSCVKAKPRSAPCKIGESRLCEQGDTCIDGECASRKKAGESCSGTAMSNNCSTGLVCAGDPTAKTCVAPVRVGGGCKQDAGCLGIETICQAGTCTPVAISDVGGPCVPKSVHKLQLRSYGCMAHLACDPATSTCVQCKIGEPCMEGSCGDTLLCDEDKCAPLRAEGESCGQSGPCAKGLGCVQGVCIAPCTNP